MTPIYEEIPYCPPEQVFRLFAATNGAIWLDSADATTAPSGRSGYSYIAADPFELITSQEGQVFCNDIPIPGDPFSVLQAKLALYSLEPLPELPPLQTGLLGYWSYDLCYSLASFPSSKKKGRPSHPDMMIGLYDTIMAFDHNAQKAWVIASGFPEQKLSTRLKRAKTRLADVMEQCKRALTTISPPKQVKKKNNNMQITSNFSQEAYQQSVSRIIDYIKAGDIFEANLSQRFSATLPRNFDAYALYERLRHVNPAPFSAFMRFNNTVIASSSPERFIRLNQGDVETRPIKGTRPRHTDDKQDALLANALLNSPKDRAENIMIVDLMRNDLSKVCKEGSVQVTQLCTLESFEKVHHLVSVVKGELYPHYTAVDLLKASFPAGSITGAPKIRAMQIIAELEPHSRGIYCGNVGYISFNGNMDTSVVIRTYVVHEQQLIFHGGGAVVLGSKPEEEYEESLAKVRVLRELLQEADI